MTPINHIVLSEQLVDINADLEIRYTTFNDNAKYYKPAGSWSLWATDEFIPPAYNQSLVDLYHQGVEFGLVEHVSIAISGFADYILTGPNGPVVQRWNPGTHNVDNGGGYLPLDTFIRHFYEGFTLCCVLQKFKRALDVKYDFEVVFGHVVTDRPAFFVHCASGSRQKQTDFNLPIGHPIGIDPADIHIICRIR